jgi:hypothetical protein
MKKIIPLIILFFVCLSITFALDLQGALKSSDEALKNVTSNAG